MNDHKQPKEDEMNIIEMQYPNLDDFKAEGLILDIGGGGEGIIGQMKGKLVIAIDKSKRELEEAPSDNLKIVMDATDLQFLDNSFETVTAFFTLMYMLEETREKTFKEVFRVLKPGGRFLIWDVIIPEMDEEEKKKSYVVPIEVKLQDKTIKTGYGVRRPAQDKEYYKKLAKKTDFNLLVESEKDLIYYLEFQKK